jgi:hypothetical protein
MAGYSEQGNEISGSIKRGEFLNRPSNYKPFKKDPA